MEIGVGMFGDLRQLADGTYQPAGQRLQEIIAEIKLMDEVGLDFFGMGEHHRADYAVASPEIILAAAASVTNRIKLGSAVSVLSSYDPVKLYQDFATIDQLSNGRAELMAGRGSFIESFPLFGYDLNDYHALFSEKLDLLLQINQHPTVTWSGKFRPALHNQPIYPRAYQEKLPIWIAVGGTPESVIRAGKLGIPIMFAIIGGNPAQFEGLFELYAMHYKNAGHDLASMQVGVHMHAFFGEDTTEIGQYYYPIYAAQMDRIGRSRGWPPYQRGQFDYGRSKQGALIIGDVSEAVDKILMMQSMFGLTRFSAHMDVGAPDHVRMMKSIELLGTQIAPKVRAALAK